MPKFDPNAFQAIKDWYTEWSRIPTYIATIAFAAMAFSITSLFEKTSGPASGNIWYLKMSWAFLGSSAALASAGIFLIYVAFDLGVRMHIQEILSELGFSGILKDKQWIRRLGYLSWICTLIAAFLLLIGFAFLIRFTLARVQDLPIKAITP